jgi:hypothetical protein
VTAQRPRSTKVSYLRNHRSGRRATAVHAKILRRANLAGFIRLYTAPKRPNVLLDRRRTKNLPSFGSAKNPRPPVKPEMQFASKGGQGRRYRFICHYPPLRLRNNRFLVRQATARARKPTTDGGGNHGERSATRVGYIAVTLALRSKMRHPFADEVFLCPSPCRHSACWLRDWKVLDIAGNTYPGSPQVEKALEPHSSRPRDRCDLWLFRRRLQCPSDLETATALAPNRFKDFWRD